MLRLLIPSACLFSIAVFGQNIITTVVGTDWVFPSASTPAVDAPLGAITGLTRDSDGNVYGADCDNHIIFKVAPAGTLTIVAGNGVAGFSPDGPAVGARLSCPSHLALNPAGELIFADIALIRKITRAGLLVTIAGDGTDLADDVPALRAGLRNIMGLTVDRTGNIYYTQIDTHFIRRIGTDGRVRTIAGGSAQGFGGDSGSASAALLAGPHGLAVGADGSVYVADRGNSRVRVIQPDGTIYTYAGNGRNLSTGDGGPADAASIFGPRALTFDSSGALLILSETNPSLRRVSADRIISTVTELTGFSNPTHITAAADGSILIADTGNARIRRIDPALAITGFAGNGNWRRTPDQSNPLAAWLAEPRSIAFSPAGLLTISDLYEFGSIRQLTAAGRLTRLASSTPFSAIRQIAFDPSGNLYAVDHINAAIRRIAPDGTVSVVAGQDNLSGFSGDGGPANRARLSLPEGVAVNAAGEVFIADTSNNRIRVVGRDGNIRTIAGTGQFGSTGDGGPAANATLGGPADLAFDAAGNLYCSERYSHRVRRIALDGTITTFAGIGVPAFSGDGGPSNRASLSFPAGLAFDAAGNLYIADTSNARVRIVRPSGTIATFAGNGNFGFSGDGGPPLNATLRLPMGVAVDPAGRVFIADAGNDRIRVVQSASPTFSLSTTELSFTGAGGASFRVEGTVNGLAWQAAVTGAPWLVVSPASGVLPAAVNVAVNAVNLTPGVHTGTITVTAPGAAPSVRTVRVTLTIASTQPPKLTIGSESITFKFQQGDGTSSLALSLANEGGGTLSYTAAVRTASGGNWLAVAPQQGQLTAGATQSLTLTASPRNLTEGTYTGAVTVTSGGSTTTIPVTLAITRAQGKILLSQTGLSFVAVEGGGAPAPQTFGVLNEGAGELPFETQATTLAGGNWLKLKNAAGRIVRPLRDVSFVEVGVDTAGLTAGDYYAEVRVTSPGVSPQIVTALVKVLPRGSNPGPEVRPTGLVFIGTPGSSPPSEDVRVANLFTGPTTYTSSSLTFDGSRWISHLPPAASILPNEPRRIVVQSNFSGITPGVKRGAVYLLFEDGTSRTVNVLSIVPETAPIPAKNGIRQAASCRSPVLRSEFLSLPEGTAATIGQPTAIEVKVADECGNLLTGEERNANSAVFAKFSNGDADVRLVPTGNGVWSGTWRPVNSSTGNVTIAAVSVYVEGINTVQGGRSERSIRLQANATTPIVKQGSLVHGASQKGDLPVAPGTLVTIYGANLATTTDQPQVLLGGQTLPVLFANATQINAQVPYDLNVNTEHQVVVKRGTTLSVGESFTVGSTQPGIFTANQQGTGQGIVIGPDQLTVATPATPAERGKVIIIYCTGLGAVTPGVTLGQPAPANPLATTVNSVTVTAGGRPAQVLFSGLTPGFTGLYQVNAVLAADTPTGNEVPITIAAGGQTSNSVTFAVR